MFSLGFEAMYNSPISKTWTLDSGLDYGLDYGLDWTVNSVVDLLFKEDFEY